MKTFLRLTVSQIAFSSLPIRHFARITALLLPPMSRAFSHLVLMLDMLLHNCFNPAEIISAFAALLQFPLLSPYDYLTLAAYIEYFVNQFRLLADQSIAQRFFDVTLLHAVYNYPEAQSIRFSDLLHRITRSCPDITVTSDEILGLIRTAKEDLVYSAGSLLSNIPIDHQESVFESAASLLFEMVSQPAHPQRVLIILLRFLDRALVTKSSESIFERCGNRNPADSRSAHGSRVVHSRTAQLQGCLRDCTPSCRVCEWLMLFRQSRTGRSHPEKHGRLRQHAGVSHSRKRRFMIEVAENTFSRSDFFTWGFKPPGSILYFISYRTFE
jgi:hypothetical protein